MIFVHLLLMAISLCYGDLRGGGGFGMGGVSGRLGGEGSRSFLWWVAGEPRGEVKHLGSQHWPPSLGGTGRVQRSGARKVVPSAYSYLPANIDTTIGKHRHYDGGGKLVAHELLNTV